MVTTRILSFVLFLGLLAAEPVSFKPCPQNADSCKINAVRIQPCPEAASNQPCKIKRGRSAIIDFDYTSDFDATTVSSRVYWASEIDLPLMDMDTDSCKYTKCPVVKDQQQSLNQSFPLSRKFPTGVYEIKWRMSSNEDKDKECCFLTSIKLTR